MKQIAAEPLNFEFSRHLEPKAHIQSGETVIVEAEDALSGQIRSNSDRRDKTQVPYSNPIAGPIFVEGAEPGDALAVSIEKIHSRDGQCATYTGNPKQLCEWLGTDVRHGAHVCQIQDDVIHWSDEITIPYTPMLGCIGTAPDWGVPSTIPAGPHGGNMDLVEVSFYDFYLNSHNVRVPLLVVVLASLSFGFFLAWLDGFIAKLKLKATIRRNGKAIQSLTEELERYKKSALSEHNESGK
ncbi:MAG: DUF1049 domain-containing protein [Nitrospinae bacterium]|nr:DUF1049 domain-containing protein [Nitrospinota bacterium]